LEVEVAGLTGVNPESPQRNVMGVDERGYNEPGLSAVIVVQLPNEFLSLLGKTNVAALLAGRHRRATVERGFSMGFGADPTGKSIAVEPVRRLVE